MSTLPTSLGALGKLPPELREDIYGQVFQKCYTLPFFNVIFGDDEDDCTGKVILPTRRSNDSLAIMFTSRKVHEECRSIFYQKSSLYYDMFDARTYPINPHKLRHGMKLLLSMELGRNFKIIGFEIYADESDGHSGQPYLEQTYRSLCKFIAANKIRDTLRFGLSWYRGQEPTGESLLGKVLISEAREWTDFKTVIFEAHWVRGQVASSDCYKNQLGLISLTLEPILGPFVLHDEDPDTSGVNRTLEFHPRQHFFGQSSRNTP